MPDIHSSHKVVVIGAGVSASCGIAVSKDILRETISALGEKSHASREVHEALKYLYPDFELEFRNYPNIEDFLNLLDMASVFNTEEFTESSLWPRERIGRVTEIVRRGLSEYIWSFCSSPEKTSKSLLAYVDTYIRPGDVIITFNWDLMIEQALSKRDKVPRLVYQYSRGSNQKAIVLLKPHGSINWYDKNSAPLVDRIDGTDLDSSVKCINHIDLLTVHDLTDDTPVIVPPLSRKAFLDRPVLSQTWNSVYRAVSDTTALIILGYSLPKEDQFSRFVLRRALRQNILRTKKKDKRTLNVVVVNPDETTEGTFARLVGRDRVNFKFHRAYFQDFVRGLQSRQ